MTKKISTIIPAYNRAGLIGATLESILAQSHPPHEVIVVDDGSTDGTPEVAEQFDSRIRVIRQVNKGAGAARNRGFMQATGEFIHFMDSDDLCSPNTYESQLEAINESGADMAYGPWVKTWFLQDNRIRLQKIAIQQRPLPDNVSLDRWLLRGWVTVFQPCLFRRSLIEKVGPYRTDLKPSEDSELLYRIGASGARHVHTPDTLLLYRVHPEAQVSVVNDEDRYLDWARFLLILQEQVVANGRLDRRTSAEFQLRKLAALRTLPLDERNVRQQLEDTVPGISYVHHAIVLPVRRVIRKLQRRKYGEHYCASFQVGPISSAQKELISKMGYQLEPSEHQREPTAAAETC